uniref:AAA+ ATPase domain-containing protein n=1 Tax=Lotharella globosa TaxID=91324 RepID=A0A7S4DG85_9EUKA|mmetsp:Transcript_14483/g.29210  ORF Transcript_14483/g.29210 Transcript_14483/m.29210 type:complete len:4315 (+) Transcript_14483:68-13012(+)
MEDNTDQDGVALNVLKSKHYDNVIKNLYTTAETADDDPQSPQEPVRHAPETEWRLKAEKKFTTRKLNQQHERRMQRKLGNMSTAQLNVKIPRGLQKLGKFGSSQKSISKPKKLVGSHEKKTKAEGKRTRIVYEHPDAEPPSRSKTLRKERERKRTMREIAVKKNDDHHERLYDIATDESKLYKLSRTLLDEMPLELFDSLEDVIRSPEEWVALGAKTGGTKAKVKVYQDKQWVWKPAKVVSFDEKSHKFSVQTEGYSKNLPRLSICFDAEDEKAFHARVERCRKLRETACSLRRYTKLIESQQSGSFAVIEQKSLQAIVERLVKYEEDLVLASQHTMRELLLEVRDDYVFAMKAHIVEYARQNDPEENLRLAHLNVPPLPPKPEVPYLAVHELPGERPRFVRKGSSYPTDSSLKVGYVIKAKERDVEWFQWLRNRVKTNHYTFFKNTSAVMLHLFKNWEEVKSNKFYEDRDEEKRPWTSYKFEEGQNDVCTETIECLQQDWRLRIINYMKVKLTNTFNLYESEEDAYNGSRMCSFLRMANMVLRNQLSTLIGQSIDKIINVVQQYQIGVEKLADKYDSLGSKPLLIFKLTANSKKVVFMPDLGDIESTIINMIDIPSKVQALVKIDSEVVPLLRLPEVPLISQKSTPLLYAKVEQAKAIAREIIKANLVKPNQLLEQYRKFQNLLEINTRAHVKAWFEGHKREEPKDEKKGSKSHSPGKHHSRKHKHGKKSGLEDLKKEEALVPYTLEETRAEIKKYNDAIHEIDSISERLVDYSMIRVDCENVKEKLIAKAVELKENLLRGLADKAHEKDGKLEEEFKAIITKLADPPKDTQTMAELKDYMERVIKVEMPRITDELAEVRKMHAVLREFWFQVPELHLKESWNVGTLCEQVLLGTRECKANLQDAAAAFEQALRKEKEDFGQKLVNFQQSIEQVKEYGWCGEAQMAERATTIAELNRALDKAQEEVESFQMREKLFEQEQGEYGELDDMRRELAPHVDLWKTCNKYRTSYSTWMTGDFRAIDPKKLTDMVQTWTRKVMRLRTTMLDEELLKPAEVGEKMASEIKEFQRYVPIITWLRNPGLAERHWKEIGEVLDIKLGKHGPDKLGELMAQKETLEERRGDLEDICSGADKEYELNRQLKEMEDEWEPIEFTVEDWKKTKTYILKGSEDVITLLDDQTLKVQAMRGSPYIKPFEARCKKWEKRLKSISATLLEWLKCQGTWLYLEPIFSSPDIQQQMKKESRMFMKVDAFWRKTMDALHTQPKPSIFFEPEPSRQTQILLETFTKFNKQLDIIQKGLSQYLETKRLAFSRFYFLSNDELLSILSQTKNVQAVQPHMNKCFDNIKMLTFTKKNVIVAMNSAAGEEVKFKDPVDPTKGAARGNVEVWLGMVETQMKDSVRALMGEGVQDYSKPSRKKWIQSKIQQVVLMVDQLYWTQEVEQAVQKGVPGLRKYLEKADKELLEIVELVRGKLAKKTRKCLGSLTILNVHGRDVVEEMIENKVEDVNQFEWLAQMRYYWEKDGDEEGVMKVRQINATIRYGYEYLGNAGRLVITQLTDRCYRTLMGAIHLHLGGAPEGPAGTGKTETVKDLSKSLAIQCVVFNCSDSITVESMARMFKGLASTGAWACFDEFNRIDIEVLSVVGQQLATIQRAVNEGKDVFAFEDVAALPLKHTCTPFITMNPGYAGRTELPDNLKVLFRTVAMMIPDYARIAEIMLYSMGYADAVPNSVKLVACLQLCSEQLSSQFHYDFGMRTVKAILVAAGNLKRRHPDAPEEKLCLSAIMDCNLPKFTVEDIPLFIGITKDLFPGVSAQEGDYKTMIEKIEIVCEEMNLQPEDGFIKKIIQLYETVMVRHGLMVVGDTYAGKSSNIKVLQAAMTMMAEEKIPSFNPVDLICLNPKSITSGQLYGSYDKQTMEWNDGIVPGLVRNCVADERERRKWVCFDGPVDALWIEDMNTVLDDNKKLCLASGEIIKLSDWMTMMFEVEDLSVASPATISRVGMVFMEPVLLGWRPLVLSWLETLPENIAPHKEKLLLMFDWMVPPCLLFLRKGCKILIPTIPDMTLVGTLIKILDCLIDEFRDEWWEEKKKTVKGSKAKEDCRFKEDRKHKIHIEGWFTFAILWAIGSICVEESRPRFDAFFRDLVDAKLEINELKEGEEDDGLPRTLDFRVNKESGNLEILMDAKWKGTKIEKKFPKAGTIFDCQWSRQKCDWVNWVTTIDEFKAPDMKKTQFHEVIVPTVDTIRASWLLETLVTHHKHTLFVGPTGTGKSVVINKKLLDELDKNKWMPLMMTFSARTDANQTQDIIDGKLDRRKQGVLGPPIGKHTVIVVDDLNMPAKEEYGAQPPIELLRQWMDYGGWYNRKEREFVELRDIQFVAAMGPPLGGRNPITERYTRHYATVGLVDYNEESLKRIYSTIVGAWVNVLKARDKASSLKNPLVQATVELYFSVSQGLLPTPSKSHYTFNLRDISKVFQGILMVGDNAIKSRKDLVCLWMHETSRVFCDRLTEKKDIDWYMELVTASLKKHFNTKIEDIYSEINTQDKEDKGKQKLLMFCDFADNKGKKMYKQVMGLTKFKGIVTTALEDYNSMTTSGKMNLVLFNAALEHVARIARILRLPFGNALLVGVGGSGRQSLAKLACHICDYTLFQVTMTATYDIWTDPGWKMDLMTVMKIAGVKNEPVVFLISDTQIKDEQFVEDINNILNNGEVPNLFPMEEYQGIVEACMADAKVAGRIGPTAIFNFFVERCKKNIHMVIALSPIGESFRNRLRMFPSLVNCTTIDWFHAWPTEALESVAKVFLEEVSLDPDRKVNDELQTAIVEVCVDMQERVQNLSHKFLRSLRRYNYVTPTSYLELIKTFQKLFKKSRDKVGEEKARYENGLQKLAETEASVKGLQVKLTEMQPGLIKAKEEVQKTMVVIAKREKEVSAQRSVIAGEEKVATEKAGAAKAIEDECQGQLDKAMPALNKAMAALKVLKQKDLTELKSFKTVSNGVKLAMEGLCYMFEQKPDKVGEPGKPKKNDFWGPAKKHLLSDSKLLPKILNYDKDNMKESVIKKVVALKQNPDFNPETIKKSSTPASIVCTWVLAMETYYFVNKEVIPKKILLKKAQGEVAVLMGQLKEKKQQLQKVEEELDDLQKEFQEVKRREAELANQVKETEARLIRAKQLIAGLSVMRDGWTVKAKDLGVAFKNVVGDVIISAGVMAYLGVFTIDYRTECVGAWKKLLADKKVPSSESYKLHMTMGHPVELQNWRVMKLPNDDFSADNAIIVTKSTRYALCIDPEGQANIWIKNLEAKNKLKVLKQTDTMFAKEVPMAVQYGVPVLVEAVQESLDPLLEPILLHQVTKNGSSYVIKLGTDTINYNPEFRIYFTTTLRNPHYPPEVSTKVVLTNFMITPDGLADQMNNFIVLHERPKLAKQATELVVKIAAMATSLKDIEDQVLKMLRESKGEILDNQELVNALNDSKVKRDHVDKQMKEAEKKKKLINETRELYAPLARFTSHLFFCITLLANVDPMYQYSLIWYMSVFNRSMDLAPQESEVDERIAGIGETFKIQLYENVCRSLFEKDKLLFSFMLCLNIMTQEERLDMAELRFLLTGGLVSGELPENPAPKWLSNNSWAQICNLSKLKGFENLPKQFEGDLKYWEEYYQDKDPLNRELPEELGELSSFHKILILRTLRPDRVVDAIQNYVENEPSLGKEFIEPPLFDLAKCFEDSSNTMPLVFILSVGADPVKEVYALGKERGFEAPDRLIDISLGQGQGVKAEKAIARGVEDGIWVVLQNCHLSVSWLPKLEKIIQDIDPDKTHKDFRLWLTSMPSPKFPVSVLQIGVKMTNEPPKGLRANLKATFAGIDDDYFDSSERKDKSQFQKLVFGLAFFHALVQERRTFGPLGWNIPYGFNDSDQDISRQQLQQLLDGYEEIPFKALRYLIGQLNYGGRVTDDWDRRLITYMCEDFVTVKMLDDAYKFEAKGIYKACSKGATLDDYNDYIAALPITDLPTVFGFDDNAIMIKNNKETNKLLDTLLGLQPRTAGGAGKSREDVIEDLAVDIKNRMPDLFEVERAKVKFPVVYSESMNTVFVQELTRFNRLLHTVKSSLVELVKALKGQVVMSTELEAMGNKIFDGQVPNNWTKVSYPSLKPLAGWVTDFLERLAMFQKWMKEGSPNVYWISGFYFTQSFLTGTKQNFARKYTIAIDDVVFDFEVVPEIKADHKEKPADGCFIRGLFLEGARWGNEENVILEALPKQLYSVMPTIQIKPCSKAKLPKNKSLYKCPVYKTSTRAGQLSTTGHSTNFVLAIDLRTRESHPEKFWVRRGVAMLTQLDT